MMNRFVVGTYGRYAYEILDTLADQRICIVGPLSWNSKERKDTEPDRSIHDLNLANWVAEACNEKAQAELDEYNKKR